MAKTASSTNTSVAQLGEGILTIGATAKSIKGGTAELNTALCTVQGMVAEKTKTSSNKSVEEIAKEVISGKWGKW